MVRKGGGDARDTRQWCSMTKTLFLSYRSEDSDLAHQITESLRYQRQDLQILAYPHLATVGREWKSKAGQLIRDSEAVLCIIGAGAHRSSAIDWEIRMAAQLGKAVLAVRCDRAKGVIPRAVTDVAAQVVPCRTDLIAAALEEMWG